MSRETHARAEQLIAQERVAEVEVGVEEDGGFDAPGSAEGAVEFVEYAPCPVDPLTRRRTPLLDCLRISGPNSCRMCFNPREQT